MSSISIVPMTLTLKMTRYIVMDLCTGSLAVYVTSKPRDLVMANSRMILGQVALAVNYLHSQNIIHKDLKPQNILYKATDCGWPHILLCDFGNTRQLRHPLVDLLATFESDRQPSEDGADAVAFKKTGDKGTAGYIAPELLETGVPSFKSDVWAMGAVVFFVVSGGQQPYDLCDRVQKGDDIQAKLNVYAKRLRCPPKVSQLEDVNAADLICLLMKFDENSRPDMSVVLIHPFFWADNPSARTHFVVKVNDFFTRNRDRTELASKLSESLNEEKLMAWYDTLDDQLKTEEIPKNLDNLQRLVKQLITDGSAHQLII
jgi:calcium/calmodulin-dependent protein kinase I